MGSMLDMKSSIKRAYDYCVKANISYKQPLRTYDEKVMDHFIHDAVSRNFSGELSAEETLRRLQDNMMAMVELKFGKFELPPLDIQFYKPPRENRYHPKLPSLADLPIFIDRKE